MSDQFNVTAAVSPSSGLVQGSGAAFTITISGNDVQTVQQSYTNTATVSLLAADGATGTVTVPITMSKTVVTQESVVITSCTDTDGRVYTVAGNGLSVSSTA